ncbi:putative polygalacturonase [Gossypium australe]|uniref:Putative polygalacturonase n=1 Tax=Gossypium australe TaxID=47621 RepID=A0A5B6UNH8_9ROSI|nr:putative polygalacturonase [Gossypium australe]
MELLGMSPMRTKMTRIVTVLVLLGFILGVRGGEARKGKVAESFAYTGISCRRHTASITDFGGVGDGKTSNTKVFHDAVNHLSKYASDGGAQLYVPAGKWLTGSFSLTSHFTLYLQKHALLLASQDMKEWPVLKPLPSYGRGRDAAGGRFTSLIYGTNLTDVIVTGANGTIDGQDSCTNVKIQDSYIVSGDDCIAVKSGWDEYGISFGMPTKQLVIRRLTCISPYSAAIALGSEMSGGIQDVRAEDITAVHTESGVRIKTARGRGGFVKDIFVRRMSLHTMKWVFWMTGNYKQHADNHYDPNALPVIQGINYRDIVANNVSMAARLEGIEGDPFTQICIANVTIGMAAKAKKVPWTCTDVEGITSGVSPRPCDLLPDQGQKKITACDFPAKPLSIDRVVLTTCTYRVNHM